MFAPTARERSGLLEANFEGVRVLGPADARCPLCNRKLSQARLLSYGLMYCESCQGMLVPMDDLVPLTDDSGCSRGTPSYVGRPPDPKDLERGRAFSVPPASRPWTRINTAGLGTFTSTTCETCSVHSAGSR